jgi:hypothetical protein
MTLNTYLDASFREMWDWKGDAREGRARYNRREAYVTDRTRFPIDFPSQRLLQQRVYTNIINALINTAKRLVYWSEFLATEPEGRLRFPTLPDFLTSSGPGTGSTQALWVQLRKKKVAAPV